VTRILRVESQMLGLVTMRLTTNGTSEDGYRMLDEEWKMAILDKSDPIPSAEKP
jgi:hypothetical protein